MDQRTSIRSCPSTPALTITADDQTDIHEISARMQRNASLPLPGEHRPPLVYSRSLSESEEELLEIVELGPANGGFFTKLKRHLSEKRKNLFGKRRKSSQESGFYLDTMFNSDIGRRLSNCSQDGLLEGFEVCN